MTASAYEFPVSELEASDHYDEQLRDRIHERLLGQCETDPVTECWVFTGPWTSRGCGHVRVGRRVYRIARVSAWVYLGVPLWQSLRVYLKCETHACFNPEHLAIAESHAAYLRSEQSLWRSQRRSFSVVK
jgi:hypothetical protein